MALSRHARRRPVTGPVAMKETHISFGGEVAFFLFVVGPFGPPRLSLALLRSSLLVASARFLLSKTDCYVVSEGGGALISAVISG